MPQPQSKDRTGRPGRPDLADFRGREPAPAKPGEVADQVAEPPVSDDDPAAGAPQPQRADGADSHGTEPRSDAPPVPERKMSPGDERRAKLMERFSKNRDVILEGGRPEPVEPGPSLAERLGGAEEDAAADGGDGAAEPAAAADDEGAQDSATEAKPETITLLVNGKTVTKTLDEIAALSEMSADEVKADPARAKRYAGKELATAENLERSKQVRETPSRPGPAARAAEDQETGDDGGDRPAAEGDTSLPDFEALVNDIQISDPKDVAPKLLEAFSKLAKRAATSTVQETEGTRRQLEELSSNGKVLKEFLDDHKEIDAASYRALGAAVSTSLDDIYRDDLRAILIEEGESEASADQILDQAMREKGISAIRGAHMRRRMNGHPLARKIDKGLIEDAYGRVQKAFGVTGKSSQQPGSAAAAPSRAERKQSLTPQPRSAAAPARTPAQPPAGDIPSRRAAIAQMSERTGKKVRTAI